MGNGGWSSDGVQVISNETRGNLTTVQCSSTHLTSFAVLVDVAGGLEVTSIPRTFIGLVNKMVFLCRMFQKKKHWHYK